MLRVHRFFLHYKCFLGLGLGKRDDASRRHPYRASSPSRAGHVTVAQSMTNPICTGICKRTLLRSPWLIFPSTCPGLLCFGRDFVTPDLERRSFSC